MFLATTLFFGNRGVGPFCLWEESSNSQSRWSIRGHKTGTWWNRFRNTQPLSSELVTSAGSWHHLWTQIWMCQVPMLALGQTTGKPPSQWLVADTSQGPHVLPRTAADRDSDAEQTLERPGGRVAWADAAGLSNMRTHRAWPRPAGREGRRPTPAPGWRIVTNCLVKNYRKLGGFIQPLLLGDLLAASTYLLCAGGHHGSGQDWPGSTHRERVFSGTPISQDTNGGQPHGHTRKSQRFTKNVLCIHITVWCGSVDSSPPWSFAIWNRWPLRSLWMGKVAWSHISSLPCQPGNDMLLLHMVHWSERVTW